MSSAPVMKSTECGGSSANVLLAYASANGLVSRAARCQCPETDGMITAAPRITPAAGASHARAPGRTRSVSALARVLWATVATSSVAPIAAQHASTKKHPSRKPYSAMSVSYVWFGPGPTTIAAPTRLARNVIRSGILAMVRRRHRDAIRPPTASSVPSTPSSLAKMIT